MTVADLRFTLIQQRDELERYERLIGLAGQVMVLLVDEAQGEASWCYHDGHMASQQLGHAALLGLPRPDSLTVHGTGQVELLWKGPVNVTVTVPSMDDMPWNWLVKTPSVGAS